MEVACCGGHHVVPCCLELFLVWPSVGLISQGTSQNLVYACQTGTADKTRLFQTGLLLLLVGVLKGQLPHKRTKPLIEVNSTGDAGSYKFNNTGELPGLSVDHHLLSKGCSAGDALSCWVAPVPCGQSADDLGSVHPSHMSLLGAMSESSSTVVAFRCRSCCRS